MNDEKLILAHEARLKATLDHFKSLAERTIRAVVKDTDPAFDALVMILNHQLAAANLNRADFEALKAEIAELRDGPHAADKAAQRAVEGGHVHYDHQ